MECAWRELIGRQSLADATSAVQSLFDGRLPMPTLWDLLPSTIAKEASRLERARVLETRAAQPFERRRQTAAPFPMVATLANVLTLVGPGEMSREKAREAIERLKANES